MRSAAAALRRMYSSRRGSSAQLTGLAMKSVAPASKARVMADESSWPVTITMGTVAKRDSALRRRHTELPSMPGMSTSSSTIATSCDKAASSAAVPLSKASGVRPPALAASASSSRPRSSSSAMIAIGAVARASLMRSLAGAAPTALR